MKQLLKTIVLILFVVWFTLTVGAERLGRLAEIYQPQSLVVSNNRVIVAQKSTFYVFALEDLKPVSRFCKEGEGPGELKFIPMIPNTILKLGDSLVAEGMNKIIEYGESDLKILTERKKGGMAWNFLPVGDFSLCTRFVPMGGDKVDMTLALVNGDLQQVKTLHSQSTVDRDKEIIMLRDPIGYGIFDDKIYVEKSDLGFVIDVYDHHADLLYRIEKEDVTPVPLTQGFKRQIVETLKNDALVATIAEREGGWDQFEKTTKFTFPEHLPVIRDMKVKNGRIYVMVYSKDFYQADLLVMDIRGTVQKIVPVPFTPSPFFTANALGKNISLWDIEENQYYYLELNGDEEDWFLNRISL